jgi:hypothetical protein
VEFRLGILGKDKTQGMHSLAEGATVGLCKLGRPKATLARQTVADIIGLGFSIQRLTGSAARQRIGFVICERRATLDRD